MPERNGQRKRQMDRQTDRFAISISRVSIHAIKKDLKVSFQALIRKVTDATHAMYAHEKRNARKE